MKVGEMQAGVCALAHKDSGSLICIGVCEPVHQDADVFLGNGVKGENQKFLEIGFQFFRFCFFLAGVRLRVRRR
jgi:hypothetical protein